MTLKNSLCEIDERMDNLLRFATDLKSFTTSKKQYQLEQTTTGVSAIAASPIMTPQRRSMDFSKK